MRRLMAPGAREGSRRVALGGLGVRGHVGAPRLSKLWPQHMHRNVSLSRDDDTYGGVGGTAGITLHTFLHTSSARTWGSPSLSNAAHL